MALKKTHHLSARTRTQWYSRVKKDLKKWSARFTRRKDKIDLKKEKGES